ncbi:MAG TPA: PIG-L family deacetylase [Armatimonadota bacterium]|nr:PIG-L family deacetylase [Armatimonadota bacterium]
MQKRVSILSIGAHAGDAEIATGLALAHHVNLGRKVAICHLTLGEKGHPKLSPEDYAKQKRDEAMAAADVIGAEFYALPYRDGELTVCDDLRLAICDVIRDCRPDVILTHWKESVHKDHITCNNCVPDAMFYAATAGFERVMPPHQVKSLYFAENWEDYQDFVPELYIEINEDDVALWEKMVKKYALFRGDIVKFPYIDYYKSLARVRGIEVYSKLATAFAVPPGARRRRAKSLSK